MSRKIIGVTVGTQLPKPNFKQTDPTKGDYIKNKPDFEGLKAQVENIQKNAYNDTEIRTLVSTNTTNIDALEELVGDEKVSDQISASLTSANSYTDASIEELNEGFSNVIYQMYGNDITENGAPTIRQIANDEANTALESAKSYTDTKTSNLASNAVVDDKISSHNTSTSAHNDIRISLDAKVDKVDGKGLSTNDYTTAEKNKLAGIDEGANKTVVDAALSGSSTNPVQNKVVNAAISNLDALVGGEKVSDQINNAIATKADSAHTHDDRYYTESEVDSKLSGKSDTGHTHSSYVNQNAFSKVTVGSTTIEADNVTDTLTLAAGSNITLTPDASGDKVTIAATDTVYTHPTSGVAAGTYKSVTVNAQGHVTAGTNPTTLSGYGITDAATKSELNAVSTLVGDTKVSTQIANAIASKSDVGHNHDDDYDAKGAADTALASAKTYADQVKNDLLNGAGAAYDTLKELGDLINDNQDAIDALETVAAGKADAEHTHDIADVTNLQTQLNAKVPTSRTVNGKALSANITLSASDVGADASGAANTALTNAKAYTDAEITEWVGDKTVSAQISTAIANKSDSGHTHDDRYYTESEIDTKLSGKSDTSHTHSAYVNQNAFSNVKVGSTTIAADSTTDTLTLVAGSNVTITPDATNDKVTIAATDTVYTHPNSGVTAGTYKSVTVNAQGHVTGGSNPTTLSGYGITDAATKTELNAVSSLVGDTKVSTQISNAIANKSDVGHNHDDVYAKTDDIPEIQIINNKYSDGRPNSTTIHVISNNEDGSFTQASAFDLASINSIPTKVSQLTNDSKYAVATDIPANVSQLTNDSGFITQNDIPTSLKNPNALTFTGAVTGSYDGSAAKTVNIPDISELTSDVADLQTKVGDTTVSEQISKAIDAIPAPDWNAAEGEDGYIANRTHYEGIGEVVLFDDSVTTKTSAIAISLVPELGKKYSVLLDGTLYENLIAFDDDGYATIGEAYNVDADDYLWVDYPFTINNNGNGSRGNIVCQTTGDHTLRIYGEGIVVHKLDSKFIHTPDWNAAEGEDGYIENRTHYTKSCEEIVILPETQFRVGPLGGAREGAVLGYKFNMFNSPFSRIVVGEKYIVRFNGIDYTCTARMIREDGEPGVMLGYHPKLFTSPSDPAIEESYSDIPIGILIRYRTRMSASLKYYDSYSILFSAYSTVATAETSYCTLGIRKVIEDTHKIDNKYIDSDWMATSELIELMPVTTFTPAENSMAAEKVYAWYPDIASSYTAYVDAIGAPDTLCVVFDGDSYYVDKTTLNLINSLPAWGNIAFLKDASIDCALPGSTGCPFAIVQVGNIPYVFVGDTVAVEEGVTPNLTPHTIAIYAVKSNKMPERFLPESVLKKPDKLIFTGATSVEYDGSAETTVNIPIVPNMNELINLISSMHYFEYLDGEITALADAMGANKNGIYAKDRNFFYYKDNNIASAQGFIIIGRYGYYVRSSGEIARSDFWVTTNNDLVPAGMVPFDEVTGRIIVGKVTTNLTNVSCDYTYPYACCNFTANLTADEGYTISSVTVRMNGGILSGVYTDGVITIDKVSGDIEITATAV